jgi:hypothetical protein
MRRLIAVILVSVLLAGCSRQQHRLHHFVILVDTSGSIEPDALAQCMQAISKVAEKADRGTIISVIPITGDSDVESSGRVLRFQKPQDRTAYDADLVQFSKKVQQSLQEFQARVAGKPARKTDIFGSIRMANEELRADAARDGTLIIFSDFLEDDGQVDFSVDRRLRTKEAATQYATMEAKSSFPSVHAFSRVYLALLRSKELPALDRQRREAIKQFWTEYFKTLGVQCDYMTDGIGLLSTSF